MPRILLMYITKHSGHHRASVAVEEAVRQLAPQAEILNVDAFQYFNPILARVVDRTYMSVIRNAPEIWDYLYDNPKVATRSQAFRRFLHRCDSPKLRELLDQFRPTAIACTQAFPCGVTADYKKTAGLSTPLYAILTDFVPHNYWLHDHEQITAYMVASPVSQTWLERSGVPSARIRDVGIPIEPKFAGASDGVRLRDTLALDPQQPMILVMGGGQGLGPIEEMVQALDALPQPFQMVVATGVNTKLQHRLSKAAPRFSRRVVVLGHVPYIPELMSVATLLVTKPGGLPTAEALAKHLPMVVVDPIPGQEVKNIQFLLEHQAAVQADTWESVPGLVETLLRDPARLAALRQAAGRLGRPRAALDVAQTLLQHE